MMKSPVKMASSATKNNLLKRVEEEEGVDVEEEEETVCGRLGRASTRVCSKKQLERKLPILEWLPKYSLEKAVADVVAGVTVGLTVIPQGIAYAIVADMPPQYGLYSAFFGCFVYCVLGSSKDVTIGPTAIMALMTAEHVKGDEGGPETAALLTFLSGMLILFMGTLRLGFLIDFISAPVISGFTSAAAVTIASSQIKALFGLTMKRPASEATKGWGVAATWANVARNFDTLRCKDAGLGISCVILLLFLRKLKDVKVIEPGEEDVSRCRRVFANVIWLLSAGRNALVVVAGLVLAYKLDPGEPDGGGGGNGTTFVLTGTLSGGLPELSLPEVNLARITKLGTAVIVIPLVAVLESIAIAKAFAGGRSVDANQEMLALGLCNLLGSLAGSMPVTGSFSRTAVNSASGVRTPMGGVYTGLLVLLCLAVLMPACAYIPKATLAAVIITAVIFSVECDVVGVMFRSKRSDAFCAIVTFLCCLFWALEVGILVGIILQAGSVLYLTARPEVKLEVKQLLGPDTEYLVARPDRALLFPSVEHVRNLVDKAGRGIGQGNMPLIVDCQYMFSADFTGAKGFMAMAADFKKRGQAIFFVNMTPAVEATLLGVGKDGEENHLVVVRSWPELKHRLEEKFFAKKENSDYSSEQQSSLTEKDPSVGAAAVIFSEDSEFNSEFSPHFDSKIVRVNSHPILRNKC